MIEVWKETKADNLATLIRVTNRLLSNINNPDDLDSYGTLYSSLATWGYQLDLLLGGEAEDVIAFYETETGAE